MAKREFLVLALLVLCRVEHVQAACQMVELPNTNIADGDLATTELPSSSTAQGCYDNCIADPTCTYARYDPSYGNCAYSTSTNPTLSSEDGSVIAKRECVADTTTTTSTTTTTTSTTTSTTTTPTTTTTTPTTTTTTTPTTTTTTPTATTKKEICLMSPSTTVVGAGTATRIDMSSSASCFDGCKYARRCSHAEYVSGAVTCNFYSSSNKFQGSTDVNSWKKDTCTTGNSGSCCFDLNLTTNDGKTPVLSLTSSLDSCKQVCLKWADCAAVSFTAPTCTIYTRTTAQTSSSTLYVKDCADSSSSSEVIDLQCQTGSTLKPVRFLIITSAVGVFVWLQWTLFH